MVDQIENVTVEIDAKGMEVDLVSKHIVGPIHVTVGNCFFPEKEWSDFAALILVAWTSETLKLISDPEHVAECHFQDGPYWFELEYASPGKWRFVACERSRDTPRHEMIETIVSASTMIAQLSAALDKLLASCKKLNWGTPDAAALSDSINSLSSDR